MKFPRGFHRFEAACVVGLALLAAGPDITAAEEGLTGVTAAASLLTDFTAADPLGTAD